MTFVKSLVQLVSGLLSALVHVEENGRKGTFEHWTCYVRIHKAFFYHAVVHYKSPQ